MSPDALVAVQLVSFNSTESNIDGLGLKKGANIPCYL